MSNQQLFTSGDLARELNAKPSRVRYLLATRGHIQPVARAGLTWLYDATAREALRVELEEREAKQRPIPT